MYDIDIILLILIFYGFYNKPSNKLIKNVPLFNKDKHMTIEITVNLGKGGSSIGMLLRSGYFPLKHKWLTSTMSQSSIH